MVSARTLNHKKEKKWYEVKRIVGHEVENGTLWVKVEWTGYSNQTTREPANRVKKHAGEALIAYYNSLPTIDDDQDPLKKIVISYNSLKGNVYDVSKIKKHSFQRNKLKFLVEWKGFKGEDTWEAAENVIGTARETVLRYFSRLTFEKQKEIRKYFEKKGRSVDGFKLRKKSGPQTKKRFAGVTFRVACQPRSIQPIVRDSAIRTENQTSPQQKVVQEKPTTSSFQYNFLDAPTVSSEEQSAVCGKQAIQQSHSAPSKPALQYVEPTIVPTSNYRPLSNSSVPGPSQVALIKPINASTTNSLPLSNHSPFPQFTNSKALFEPYPPPFIPTQLVNDMKSTLLSNFNPLPTFNHSGPGTSVPWHCQIINQTHPAPIPIVQQFGRVKPLLYVSRKRTQIPPEMEHIAFQGTYKIEAEGRDRTGKILAGAYYGITINCIARIPNELWLNGSLIDFMIHNYANKNLSEEQWKSFFLTDQSFMSIGSVENENLEEFFKGKAERTRGIDFFSKDLVVLPLLLNNHWMICFVKNLKNCVSLGWSQSTENCEVIIFNSYRSSAFDKWVEKVVRVWLRRTVQDQLRICEIPAQFNENQMKFYAPKNFQNQTDMHSCGVYVILFAKTVFESFDNFMSTEDHSLIDWNRFRPNAQSEINDSMTRDGQEFLFNEVISFTPRLNGVVTFEDICEFQKKYPDNF